MALLVACARRPAGRRREGLRPDDVAPLREGKGSAFEGGTRIPLRISWAHPDAGEELQQRLLVASGGTCATRPLVFHHPHVWGPRGRGYQPHGALRLGDWKAIYFCEGREWELHDLAADPGEREDLAALTRAGAPRRRNTILPGPGPPQLREPWIRSSLH